VGKENNGAGKFLAMINVAARQHFQRLTCRVRSNQKGSNAEGNFFPNSPFKQQVAQHGAYTGVMLSGVNRIRYKLGPSLLEREKKKIIKQLCFSQVALSHIL